METEELMAFLESAGIRPGARILDAPCGIGRRARALADHGYRVTAVDANPVAIEALRRRVPKASRDRLECREAPAGSLPGLAAGESFDAALCLDHAIGRDRREEDVAFLARLRNHVAPQGLLLVDFLHRDFFAGRPRPFAYHVVGEVEQHEFRAFDPVTRVLELTWKFYRREGADLRYRGISSLRLPLLAPHEAEAMLREAGWSVEALYGGWDKVPLSADRRKLVLLARPSARS